MFDELSDIFKTKDGYVRLHANLSAVRTFPSNLIHTSPCSSICTAPSHKQGLLDILQCEPPKAAVASALAEWSAEAVALRRHLCAAALRSFEIRSDGQDAARDIPNEHQSGIDH